MGLFQPAGNGLSGSEGSADHVGRGLQAHSFWGLEGHFKGNVSGPTVTFAGVAFVTEGGARLEWV